MFTRINPVNISFQAMVKVYGSIETTGKAYEIISENAKKQKVAFSYKPNVSNKLKYGFADL
jgi:hypothetical protein